MSLRFISTSSLLVASLMIPVLGCGSGGSDSSAEASSTAGDDTEPSFSEKADSANSVKMKGWLPYDTDVNGQFDVKFSGYSFAGKQGGTVIVSSSTPGAVIKLYGPKKAASASSTGWGDAVVTGEVGASVTLELPADGEYAALISAADSKNQPYSLKLTCDNFACVYPSYDWVALVYGSFDTNEKDDGMSSLSEMKSSIKAAPKRTYLLYLEDLPGDNNTKLHRITNRGASSVVQDFGELSMQRPENLTKAIQIVRTLFPASRFYLNLIGHTNSGVRAFLPDYTPDDGVWEHERMMYWQVRDALKNAGFHIDVLGISGCGTGDLEIMYALKDSADYITELQEESFGYRDTSWAGSLASNSNISPESLAVRVSKGGYTEGVNAPCEEEGAVPCPPPSATGAIETSELDTVKETFTALNTLLNAKVSTCTDELVSVRNGVQEMFKGYGFDSFIDAYDFADQLVNRVSDDEVKNSAQAFRDALSNLIVAGGPPDYADEEHHAGAHGLNLLFMRKGASGGNYFSDPSTFDSCSAYQSGEARFYKETGWIDFVTTMYDKIPAP